MINYMKNKVSISFNKLIFKCSFTSFNVHVLGRETIPEQECVNVQEQFQRNRFRQPMSPESVFVNLLRSPKIDSQPGGSFLGPIKRLEIRALADRYDK
jgi:hypothetical protein